MMQTMKRGTTMIGWFVITLEILVQTIMSADSFSFHSMHVVPFFNWLFLNQIQGWMVADTGPNGALSGTISIFWMPPFLTVNLQTYLAIKDQFSNYPKVLGYTFAKKRKKGNSYIDNEWGRDEQLITLLALCLCYQAPTILPYPTWFKTPTLVSLSIIFNWLPLLLHRVTTWDKMAASSFGKMHEVIFITPWLPSHLSPMYIATANSFWETHISLFRNFHRVTPCLLIMLLFNYA
jgi:hypothetical protein